MLIVGLFRLECAQRFVGEVGRGVVRGLDEDYGKIAEVIDATKDIIPAFGLVSTGAVPSRRKLASDPRVLEDLKAIEVKLVKGFSQVSQLLSEGTKKVALAEAKLAERPEHLDKQIYVKFKQRGTVEGPLSVGSGQGAGVHAMRTCGVHA